MALIEFFDTARDGPLLQGLTLEAALRLVAAGDPGALVDFVNPKLVEAEARLPEGSRVQLAITGWPAGQAAVFAEQIQQQWREGRISSGGEVPAAWPEHPDRIAFGDDATDTVTLRWIKALPWAWLLVAAITLLLAGALLAWYLQGSQAKGSYAPPTGGGTPGGGVLTWLLRNWPWLLLAAGGLAISPWVVRQLAALTAARRQLAEAER